MARVITFSTVFPAHHPRKGEPTGFEEKIITGEKKHTIRSPKKKWKVGDKFSPRVWTGKPYRSKQREIKEVMTVKKVWDIEIEFNLIETIWRFKINGVVIPAVDRHFIWENDGLEDVDFWRWFVKDPNKDYQLMQTFKGQIICWDEKVDYGVPAKRSLWFKTEDKLPEEGVPVLGHRVNANPTEYFVVRLVKGISMKEREKMSKMEDPPTEEVIVMGGHLSKALRHKTFHKGDEHGNNLVPYHWSGPGPFDFFGQEIDRWMLIPEEYG